MVKNAFEGACKSKLCFVDMFYYELFLLHKFAESGIWLLKLGAASKLGTLRLL